MTKLYNVYDRKKRYYGPGDILKVVDYVGNVMWVKVARAEPMGEIPIRFAEPGNTLNSGDSTNWIPLDFLEPPSESRITHVRPMLKMINMGAPPDHNALPNGVVYPMGVYVPALIKVQWQVPAGVGRGGTDVEKTITVNGITQSVGGLGNGYWLPHAIPYQDDPNETYDIFLIRGTYPAVKITNDSPLDLGNESKGGTSTYISYDFAYELVFTGMRYVTTELSPDEYEKIQKHEITDYGRMPVGGIPQVTTKT